MVKKLLQRYRTTGMIALWLHALGRKPNCDMAAREMVPPMLGKQSDATHDQRMKHRDHSGRTSTRLVALFKQRCPRCLQGQVFAGQFRMHARCPTCKLPFEREPGYFTGAMYLSYGLGLVATVPVWLPMVWAGRSVGEVLLASSSVLLLGSPWLFRYSRLLWLYLDHALDPR
jgi:uncharacterized protein (DUF983 family)